jgi:hypothetical protein
MKASELCKIGNNMFGRYIYSIAIPLSTLSYSVLINFGASVFHDTN